MLQRGVNMRCSKCKNELSETDKYCSCCGKSVNKNDSIWMLILGFLFPYPSIIAYICLRYSKSSIGSNLIKGAIVQIIIQFVLSAIIFVFAFCSGIRDGLIEEENNEDYEYSCNIYCEGNGYEIKGDRCVCEDGKIFEFDYR